MMIYRALGALLQYPSPGLAGAAGDIAALVDRERALSRSSRSAVSGLAARLAREDLLAAQEAYVGLFDRSRNLSLHLFEHIHGESRDRGQAMVNLAEHYRTKGYSIGANELPDYLPLFLEFLSLVEPREASDLIGDVVHILAAIRVRLERRGSDYAGVLRALEDLAARRPDRALVEGLLQHDKSPAEEAAEIDSEWEEAPAFDGAPDGGCVAARDVLNRMAVPPDPPRPPGIDGA